jgi:hypothetical protein
MELPNFATYAETATFVHHDPYDIHLGIQVKPIAVVKRRGMSGQHYETM